MITLDQAKQLRIGQILHHVSNRNADGTPQRWKVTSVKTWKREPYRIEIGLKNGLRNYDKVTKDHLHLLTFA